MWHFIYIKPRVEISLTINLNFSYLLYILQDFNAPHVPLKTPAAKKLLGHINKTFGTLAFCRRWLERDDGGSFTVNGISVSFIFL